MLGVIIGISIGKEFEPIEILRDDGMCSSGVNCKYFPIGEPE